MTKTQKIWFALFMAMFVVPEVLWSQFTILIVFWAINFFTGYWPKELPDFSLMNFPASQGMIMFISLIKVTGLIASLIIVKQHYNPKNNIIRFFAITLLSIFSILVIYAFIASVNFNPQIG